MSDSEKLLFEGKAFRYGDNIDTDVIIPARHLTTSDPIELAAHCMEDIDQNFAQNVRQGDFIVAGENFGCGSSREHAPIAIKASGIVCVIAASFARIFYRNAVNIGLPILECPDASDGVEYGDTLSVDLVSGTIRNVSKKREFPAHPLPEFMQEIIRAGGLVKRTKLKLEGK
jgi:3-isopropylmalate/(R)-2-methylmalate dehydratase small subunit